MEVDLQDPDSIVYIAGSDLFKLKLKHDGSEPIIDRLTEEGVLNDSLYPSFAQMDQNSILIVDMSNHCIIWIKRSSCAKPQPLVGDCGE